MIVAPGVTEFGVDWPRRPCTGPRRHRRSDIDDGFRSVGRGVHPASHLPRPGSRGSGLSPGASNQPERLRLARPGEAVAGRALMKPAQAASCPHRNAAIRPRRPQTCAGLKPAWELGGLEDGPPPGSSASGIELRQRLQPGPLPAPHDRCLIEFTSRASSIRLGDPPGSPRGPPSPRAREHLVTAGAGFAIFTSGAVVRSPASSLHGAAVRPLDHQRRVGVAVNEEAQLVVAPAQFTTTLGAALT